jgi:lipopolysaccharide/colanic/teichoic acid biosynthesis glycosyltransferase
MKRLFDIIFSLAGLLLMSPVLLISILLIWLQDFSSPFYIAPRVGRYGKTFRMAKLRSMVAGAEKSGVDSTAATDQRITWVGHLIRRYKLDEFSQLWNVLKGDMSIVGPRPNVQREVVLYTEQECHLLDVRPGVTDLASIVFSDEGDILAGSEDPDLKYNQVIRPWKSRLGLLYVRKRSFLLDLQIIWLTVIAILSRERALRGVQRVLKRMGGDTQLLNVALRKEPLQPYPPPGSDRIVESREPASGLVKTQD